MRRLAPTRQSDQVRVRPLWATGEYMPPFILDRRAGTLAPFNCAEWHRVRAGAWYPTIGEVLADRAAAEYQAGLLGAPEPRARYLQPFRGLTMGFQYPQMPIALGLIGTNVGSPTGHPLNATFVQGLTGSAYAAVYGLGEAKVASAVYYYVTQVVGTPAVQDVEIRSAHATLYKPGVAGGDLLASNTFTHTFAANTWYKTNGSWSATPTHVPGTRYWLVICNKLALAASHFTYGLRDLGDGLDGALPHLRDYGRLIITSNGFAAITDLARKWAGLILVFTDGTTLGCPLVNEVVNSSAAKHRGARWEEFGFYAKVHAVIWHSAVTTFTGVKWSWGATLPNSAEHSATGVLKDYQGNVDGCILGMAPQLTPASSFRVSLQVTGMPDKPNDASYGTNGVDDTIRSVMPGGGKWYKTEDSGSNTWADDTSKIPRMGLLPEDVWTGPLG